MKELVEVYVASDITFAYLVKAQLEDAGIPVHIDNENLGGAYSIDGMVPRVLVPAARAEEARAIITEMQQASPNGQGDLENTDDEEE